MHYCFQDSRRSVTLYTSWYPFGYIFCEVVSTSEYSNMAAKEACSQAVHKLHVVRLIRSGIRQPWWEKRTLKALGLTRPHKVVIHKNTPAVNGLLRTVKHLIDVKPLEVIEEPGANSQNDGQDIGTPVFLKANGQFDMQKYQEFCKNAGKTPGK